MDECNCICCGNILEAESNDEPLTISGIYGGLIFRSVGNFGSTIFDPMPTQREEMLQVIICDECIKNYINLVSHIRNIDRLVTADIGPFEIKGKEDV